MWEYILETNSPKKCQTKLNQWRHNYEVEIFTIESVSKEETFMALRRRRKEREL